MKGFKEFQSKDLDSAIADACSYYATEREKLEIEIIQDAKSGIFGIVGARKAKIRARRVQLRDTLESILGKQADKPAASGRTASGARGKKNGPAHNKVKKEQHARRDVPPKDRGDAQRQAAVSASCDRACPASQQLTKMPADKNRPAGHGEKFSPQLEKNQEQAPAPHAAALAPVAAEMPLPSAGDEAVTEKKAHASQLAGGQEASAVREKKKEESGQARGRASAEPLDAVQLQSAVRDVVLTLVGAVLGQEPELSLHMEDGKVHVGIECEEDSGLLIGREGQTLAALQYMVSRIVARKLASCVRIQLDAGDYRLRQDEKLREMALALAAKVRESGRSYSTRPLSSYHRRIVHVCLQDFADVQTRSSGEGPLKRVVIMRKKIDRHSTMQA